MTHRQQRKEAVSRKYSGQADGWWWHIKLTMALKVKDSKGQGVIKTSELSIWDHEYSYNIS